jgi:uncharacterized membrane protein
MYDTFIFLAILSAAMLTGLMTTLLTVMRGVWLKDSDEVAARNFKSFLAHAATNRILSTLSIMPVISGIAIMFIDTPKGDHSIYAKIGAVVFLIGFFLWTAFLNLPIYKKVAAWNDDETPSDTRMLIRRFHTVNIVRLAAALSTTILFFIAI